MRLERSACGDRSARGRAARIAGAEGLTGSGAAAVSRLSDTRIGDEKNSAPMASMRGTNRSFTHCSTKRLGASKRSSPDGADRKSTRLNSSHLVISYAVFCLKKKRHSPMPYVTCSRYRRRQPSLTDFLHA